MKITLHDLKTNAKFRGTLFLDKDRGAYENHYQSQTYPRLVVVKSGGPRGKNKRPEYSTTYFVDGVECPGLDAVLAMLNAERVP
jgi:hypothetical protein